MRHHDKGIGEGRAWATSDRPGALDLVVRAVPDLRPDEILVRVQACGVCRTDLHVIDAELPVHRRGVVPGHQVVGTVVAAGSAARTFAVGDIAGVAWLRRTCGSCRWCREGRENLCPRSSYTGWDADGGFADLVSVPEAFAYHLPAETDPVVTAPLLCAGIIGYRALVRANVPAGGRLGLYGFGSSAHLTAQVALAQGVEVYAVTRGAASRELARRTGAAVVAGPAEPLPRPLDSAIVFASSGDLVPAALRATERGGTVVLAGIHMSDLPGLSYDEHLFRERDLRTVTANTRADGDALLRLAAALQLAPSVTTYDFLQARDAVADLRAGTVSGSLVLVPS